MAIDLSHLASASRASPISKTSPHLLYDAAHTIRKEEERPNMKRIETVEHPAAQTSCQEFLTT